MTSILPTEIISLCDLPVDFNRVIIFRSFHHDFLYANLATPITSYRFFSNLRCAGHLIHSGNSIPASSCALPGLIQSCIHFSKPPPRVLVCEYGNFDRSGPFVFKCLVGTHAPRLKTPLAPSPACFRLTFNHLIIFESLLLELSRANPPN